MLNQVSWHLSTAATFAVGSEICQRITYSFQLELKWDGFNAEREVIVRSTGCMAFEDIV